MTATFLGITIDSDINLGNLIVGAGTGLLAFFTWRLARQTKREVDETQKSIELTAHR